MRVWRTVKALGCAVLRDGVYLLPNRKEFRQTLQNQADDVISGGGNTHILVLNSENSDQQGVFEHLFDRSMDYAKLIGSINQANQSFLHSQDDAKWHKQLQRLRKEFEIIALQDYFPGPAKEQTSRALVELEYAVMERLMPGEPHAIHRQIKPLQIADYQGRIWATRQCAWIDGLASAWLIQRFIDTNARFIWLAELSDCPDNAIGYDFDGATFSHVWTKVTFEVLLASFGLATDNALNHMGGLVHYLDVGGIPIPEAVGLETLIRGMKQRWPSDDDLLIETNKIFDAYYQAFLGVAS
jgi:hypothetical protein